ncbi:MaoC family dehydratase [Salinarimonas soli]|uniref:MaoC family dehydratase n=1 Tax=Salinarimonas soli TaxID=1638099 RepID=A0A5B2VE05_9HYPH|nr:MaoC family dehydratase [Salinarimonas soli]KAA2236652.1 MaoC family dehydratase [Salinarimonas soli]
MPRYHFEDFEPGSTMAYGAVEVTADDIVAFARDFDPQVFHLDAAAARETFAGELIGSGWHTCALLMRMIADGFILDSASQGAPGIEEVKWMRPLRPGDRVSARHTVLEARASKSRPDLGLVRFRFEIVNAAGEPLATQTNWIMIGRRGMDGVPAAPLARTPATGEGAEPAAPAGDPPEHPFPFFESVAVGTVNELGSHRFGADEIVRFARAFDPQRFHVDAEAARGSLFGALCASGWHTGALWMRHMVEHRRAAAEAARARGLQPASLGPSPGFRDLKWLKPVYVDDVITYRSTVTDKRASASRPDWGLVFNENTGHNQHGELVFAFQGCVFWEREPRS